MNSSKSYDSSYIATYICNDLREVSHFKTKSLHFTDAGT